jgi:hypothetical protein
MSSPDFNASVTTGVFKIYSNNEAIGSVLRFSTDYLQRLIDAIALRGETVNWASTGTAEAEPKQER